MTLIVNSTDKKTVKYNVVFSKSDYTEVIGYRIEFYDHINHKTLYFNYDLNEHDKAIKKYNQLSYQLQ